jgi:hypothetical protein
MRLRQSECLELKWLGGIPADYIPAECNSPYNTLDLSTSKGRAQLAIVLIAYSTTRPVKLALQCIGERPLITHIMFLWFFIFYFLFFIFYFLFFIFYFLFFIFYFLIRII